MPKNDITTICINTVSQLKMVETFGKHKLNSAYILVDKSKLVVNESIYFPWCNYFDAVEAAKDKVNISKHVLVVHSYKGPTFCDYCDEFLWGLVSKVFKSATVTFLGHILPILCKQSFLPKIFGRKSARIYQSAFFRRVQTSVRYIL